MDGNGTRSNRIDIYYIPLNISLKLRPQNDVQKNLLNHVDDGSNISDFNFDSKFISLHQNDIHRNAGSINDTEVQSESGPEAQEGDLEMPLRMGWLRKRVQRSNDTRIDVTYYSPQRKIPK